jgi:acetyl-CoA carboxylase carboxyl transferase subunit alpha
LQLLETKPELGMKETILEFEKPIYEMEKKLDEMRSRTEKMKEKGKKKGLADLETSCAELETQVLDFKKQVYGNLSRWERVQLSRHPDRPYTLDYINNISEDFIELFGDRNFGDDKAIVGGFGRVGQQTVMFIGQQKGRDTKQRQFRNFGMPNPEGYRKALRLMKLAEKFDKPVVTLIDTPGAYPGLEAEERGQGEAIARNLKEMAVLKVPIICIVIGEGASGGALGIGLGDRIYQMENTWYSVISPESCSSILWRNWDHKEEAAEALKLAPQDNLDLKIIDGIIPEPLGGANQNPEEAFKAVRERIMKDIRYLKTKTADKLIEHRVAKFSAMGVFEEEGKKKIQKKA